ncbi:dihydroneopterin aldolase [Moraxella haemolytica]|uniref:dihydroneopterin aldolase n=1 Tax=Moraxella TaxID=475 RepID=UPI00254270CF|nr:dihydroneopterin aldolase [Moraxella sp. ZY171148]WII96068.1 dihydroneopterin aldolase [Moraxella sp. ZY171148]
MNDIVFIQGLKIDTVVGVYDWEQAIKQSLVIDAKINCDISQATVTDDVMYAINYKTVCEDIERICHEMKAKLLESLAETICQHILKSYPCSSISLTIHKPNAIKHAHSVGVSITRSK